MIAMPVRSGGNNTSRCTVVSLLVVTPNPSIERTLNGGAQLRASATPSAPLRSAHVER